MPTLNGIGKEKVVNHHLEVPFYTLERKYGFNGEDGADMKGRRYCLGFMADMIRGKNCRTLKL